MIDLEIIESVNALLPWQHVKVAGRGARALSAVHSTHRQLTVCSNLFSRVHKGFRGWFNSRYDLVVLVYVILVY